MNEFTKDLPKGHTLLCGWNRHALQVVRELLASNHTVTVIVARDIPAELAPLGVSVIAGSASDQTILVKAGALEASSVIILAENADNLSANTVDAHSILTALAVENLRPEIYSVLELVNPDNKLHAQHARVDSIVFCDQIIAHFIALCASQRGLSDFVSDIFSHSDNRSSLCTLDIGPEWDGKTIGSLFDALREKGELPLAVLRRSENDEREEWSHEINPPAGTMIARPMKAVYIHCKNSD